MNMSIFHDMTDLQLLTLCIYGEARGEGLDGMLAVASVVMNRAKHPCWWGVSIGDVILKHDQFSCFNEKDVNREILSGIAGDYAGYIKTNPSLRAAQWIAKGLMDGQLYGNVGPSTHYHNIRCKPSWAFEMDKMITIGHQVFYVEKEDKKKHG